MPELPEVEAIRRGLLPLTGARVEEADCRDPMLFAGDLTPTNLSEQVTGQTIQGFERRGKYLLITVGTGRLVISVRMTGHLTVGEENPRSANRLGFRFSFRDRRVELFFTTVRRLSRLYWWAQDEDPPEPISRLGPDPLRDDFTYSLLADDWDRRRGPVKPLLMDQGFMAGIGNIYASELCYRVGLDPRTSADDIPASGRRELVRQIPAMLWHAAELGGSSFTHFRDSRNNPGRFHWYHRVYDRAGEPCLDCGDEIKQITQSGRSTYFCETCQHDF